MKFSNRKAFTMLELVFVIAIIGILAAVAIPKLAATRDDAEMAKAKTIIGTIQSALATERQKRVLRGDFTAITSISNNAAPNEVFADFSDDDGDGVTSAVFETTVFKCKTATSKACWVDSGGGTYTYRMPWGNGTVVFTITGGKFTCNSSDINCTRLTQ